MFKSSNAPYHILIRRHEEDYLPIPILRDGEENTLASVLCLALYRILLKRRGAAPYRLPRKGRGAGFLVTPSQTETKQ